MGYYVDFLSSNRDITFVGKCSVSRVYSMHFSHEVLVNVCRVVMTGCMYIL